MKTMVLKFFSTRLTVKDQKHHLIVDAVTESTFDHALLTPKKMDNIHKFVELTVNNVAHGVILME